MKFAMLPLAIFLSLAVLGAAAQAQSLRERLALRRGVDAIDRGVLTRAQKALAECNAYELEIRTFTPQQWSGIGPFKSTKYAPENWVDAADLNKGDWVMVNSTNVIVATPGTPGRELETLRFKDYEDVLSGVFEFGVAELVDRWEPSGGTPKGPLKIAKFASNPVWDGRTYRRVPPSGAFPTGLLFYRTFTGSQDQQAKVARKQRDQARHQARVDVLGPWVESWKQVVGLLPRGQWVPMAGLRRGDVVLRVGEPAVVYQTKPLGSGVYRAFLPPEKAQFPGYVNLEVYCGAPRRTCDFSGWDADEQVQASTRLVVNPFGSDQAQMYRLDPRTPEAASARKQADIWELERVEFERQAALRKQRQAEEEARIAREREEAERELQKIRLQNAERNAQRQAFNRSLASGGGSSGSSARDSAWWSSYRRFESARMAGQLPTSARFDPNKSW